MSVYEFAGEFDVTAGNSFLTHLHVVLRTLVYTRVTV